jgi:hypothetical protein
MQQPEEGILLSLDLFQKKCNWNHTKYTLKSVPNIPHPFDHYNLLAFYLCDYHITLIYIISS